MKRTDAVRPGARGEFPSVFHLSVRSCSGSRTVNLKIENNGSDGFGAIGFVVVKEAFSFRGTVWERRLFDAGFFGDSAIGDSACSFLPIFRTPPLDLRTDVNYSPCMTISPYQVTGTTLRRSVSSAGETVMLFNYTADILDPNGRWGTRRWVSRSIWLLPVRTGACDITGVMEGREPMTASCTSRLIPENRFLARFIRCEMSALLRTTTTRIGEDSFGCAGLKLD